MGMKYNAVKLDDTDNVAVALDNLSKGSLLYIQENNQVSKIIQDIPYGHKISLCTIPKGGKIIKYGECIGIAKEEIRNGHHVHVFNTRGLYVEERYELAREGGS